MRDASPKMCCPSVDVLGVGVDPYAFCCPYSPDVGECRVAFRFGGPSFSTCGRSIPGAFRDKRSTWVLRAAPQDVPDTLVREAFLIVLDLTLAVHIECDFQESLQFGWFTGNLAQAALVCDCGLFVVGHVDGAHV